MDINFNTMRVFIFSKKFAIPFITGFGFYIFCTLCQLWQLYKDDVIGKNLPFSIKYGWFLYQAVGSLITLCFLLAFLTGVTYFAHQYSKVHLKTMYFLSGKNLMAVMIIAVTGFLYVSFIRPLANYRSITLLADIYYMRPGETFKRTEGGRKSESMLSLSQLLNAKDSLNEEVRKKKKSLIRNIKMNIAESEVDNVTHDLRESGLSIERKEILNEDASFSSQKGWECCVKNTVQNDIQMFQRQNEVIDRFDFQKAEMIAYPLNIFLFYIAGLLLGILTRKISVVFPLLAAHLIIFPLWYYGQGLLKIHFLQGKSGIFMVAFWPLGLGALFILSWWIAERKQNRLREDEVLLN